jgi:hypothetical protein
MVDSDIARIWRDSQTLNALTFLTSASLDVVQTLRSALLEGSEVGEDTRRLTTRVQRILDTDRDSAFLITQNTLGYVLSRVRYEGAIEAGMTHKAWNSGAAGCPCEGHDAASRVYTQKPIPIEDPFNVNGILMQHPRDFSCERPSECVGCQCLMLPKRVR